MDKEELQEIFAELKKSKKIDLQLISEAFSDTDSLYSEMTEETAEADRELWKGYTKEEKEQLEKILTNDKSTSDARMYSFLFDLACIGNDFYKGSKCVLNGLEKTYHLGKRVKSDYINKSETDILTWAEANAVEALNWIDTKLNTQINSLQEMDK